MLRTTTALAGRSRLSSRSSDAAKWYDRAGQLLPLSLRRRQALGSVGLQQLELGPPEAPLSQRERHLPLTKASLVRLLSKEAEAAGGDGGGAKLELLALALDNAMANRFYGGLRDLRQLFRPLNPDDDTPQNLLSRRERLDGEYSFLQRLSGLLRVANFRELGRDELEACLRPHASPDGVTVCVDAGRYDVLKVWTAGSEMAAPAADGGGWFGRAWFGRLWRRGAGERRVHQRLLLAVRLRRSDRLTLKMFKNVDADSVDMLLPEGNLVMSSLDRGVIFATLTAGLLGTAFSFYAWQHHLLYVQWSGVATCCSLLAAFRGVAAYKERKARHLTRLNSLAYYGCLASNRPLLALLTELAGDAALKEALLAYWLLLCSAPATCAQLEQLAQDWTRRHCGADVDFDLEATLDLLLSLGLARPAGEGGEGGEGVEGGEASPERRVVALGVGQALALLPPPPPRSHWLLADQSDGFEKDRYALLADRERRQLGWK